MTVEDEVGGPTRTLPIHAKGEIESFEYVDHKSRQLIQTVLTPSVSSIVEVYNRLLAQDAEVTMPIAAIEALIEALSHSKSSTIYETIDLVKTQSAKLRAGVKNHIALSHGTDIFQQYLIMSLRMGPDSKSSSTGTENFEVLRQHLLTNGRLFVRRAKEQREQIASVARDFLKAGGVIMVHGDSRVVTTLLCRAKETIPKSPRKPFTVIYVVSEPRRKQSEEAIAALRKTGIRVAVIPESAVAYCMPKVKAVIVGAEAITADGGIISRMGTLQLARLAKSFYKQFYVAAEQHKIGKTAPLSEDDLGFDQEILNFQREEPEPGEAPAKPVDEVLTSGFVDYTPSELITSFFCNHGIKLPSAIAKEVIDMYI